MTVTPAPAPKKKGLVTQILDALGDPNDVRTFAAIAAGTLATIFHGSLGTDVTAAVDAGAALVVAVDQAIAAARKSL